VRRSGVIWVGRAFAGAVLVGLAIYFFHVGLDKADKLASVLGLFVALLALTVPYLIGRRASATAPIATGTAAGPRQSVVNTTIGGNLTQVIGISNKVTAHAASCAEPADDTSVTDAGRWGSRGRYVNGLWVAGSPDELDDASTPMTPMPEQLDDRDR
jgi:hypothetical protein